MDYEKLPADMQEWGRQIELEYIQTISDRAIEFQAAQTEIGRTVSITEAVHHVTARIRKAQESKVEPLSVEDQAYLDLLGGKSFNVSEEDAQEAPDRARKRAALKEFQDAGVSPDVAEIITTLALDGAFKFQTSEAEAGRVVSITDAVYHVLDAGAEETE